MKTYKLLPYEQYELAAIEHWLNEQGQKGLRLTSIGSLFVVFEKEPDKSIYYRVRYIPGNRDCTCTVFWGDLYVYSGVRPADLPAALPEDYQAAAQAATTRLPKRVLFVMAMLVLIIRGSWDLLTAGYTVAGVLGFVAAALYFFSAVNRFLVVARLSGGATPTPTHSKKYIKNLYYISFVLVLILAIFSEVFL